MGTKSNRLSLLDQYLGEVVMFVKVGVVIVAGLATCILIYDAFCIARNVLVLVESYVKLVWGGSLAKMFIDVVVYVRNQVQSSLALEYGSRMFCSFKFVKRILGGWCVDAGAEIQCAQLDLQCAAQHMKSAFR